MDYVNSTAIKAIDYNEVSKTLTIIFHNSPTPYVFYEVPKGVYVAFLNANSKGDFYHREIKGKYSLK